MLARHILSRRLARDRFCAVDREDAPRPVGRACLRQRNGMAYLGGHDVPLSFHPAATRVLGLVTPRSVG